MAINSTGTKYVCYSCLDGYVFLPVERVKRQVNTNATTEMQAMTIKVISTGVIVYSFVFNIYPTTKKLIPDKMPAKRMGSENLSDIIFPKTNAANETLLMS